MTGKGKPPEWLEITPANLDYINAKTIGQDDPIPNFVLGGSMRNFFKDPIQRMLEGNKPPEQLRQEERE